MPLVDLRNVSIEYPIPHMQNRRLLGAFKDAAIGGVVGRRKIPIIRALTDVTLKLKDGDRLGILGRNGAGKTTLLKTIAAILPPTQGSVRIEGRISPLISMNLGIDGEANGYENIRIRGRMMGFSDEQIEAFMPEIAEFTELGDYLNMPLKTYSSGMRMRVTFAASTAFNPEVLILDEWLSAGDAQFREKAAERLNNLISRAGIVVFASHNPKMIEEICDKGLILKKGKVSFFGDVKEALQIYADEGGGKKESGEGESRSVTSAVS